MFYPNGDGTFTIYINTRFGPEKRAEGLRHEMEENGRLVRFIFHKGEAVAEQEEKLQAAMVQLEQQKAKRTKKTQQVENQLSLFDSVA